MKKRPTSDTSFALQSENAALKQLMRALKAVNAKLQKKVAQLEAKDVSSSNRIKALEKQKLPLEVKPMSDNEIAREIAFALNKGGYELVDGKVVKVKEELGS